jgi:2-amino-4-hydroxy-6-hydroxymethyldihydropteridine diphosphokinase
LLFFPNVDKSVQKITNNPLFDQNRVVHLGRNNQSLMEICYLLLGSNTGNRLAYLQKAVQAVSSFAGHVTLLSSVYETAPWGFEDHTAFLNQVIEIRTNMQAEDLMKNILAAENLLGRQRFPESSGYVSRTIDIDLLFYGQHIIEVPGLTIPHPRLHQRMFTLVPLAEIAPELFHPGLKNNIAELKRICPDKLKVVIFANNNYSPSF